MMYFLLAVFIIPFIGALIYYLVIDFWDDTIRWIKAFSSCLGQLVVAIAGIVIALIVLGWIFKSCPAPDPDSGTYDYDPGLIHRRY